MEFDATTYALAIGAGLLAGIVNTMAGSGSLITLPMLVFLGLPTHVANGTNRVGVTIQNIVSLVTLRRHEALDLNGSAWFIVPTLLGAGAGAVVAADLPEQWLDRAIGGVMVVMLIVLLINPKRWLDDEATRDAGRPPWWLLLAFVAIGFYGGFIQAGVGVLLLVGLVMGAGLAPLHANGIKLFLTLLFTVAALGVFIVYDQVAWTVGLVVAIGQATGAWLAARFLAQSERAGVWIRRVLIAVVAVSALKFFGAF
jgi:uncharacterized membrane protein YfcA